MYAQVFRIKISVIELHCKVTIFRIQFVCETLWWSYLQQQAVIDLREDGHVVIDVGDGDGDEDRRRQWGISFVCCLHCQRVVRDLWRRANREK